MRKLILRVAKPEEHRLDLDFLRDPDGVEELRRLAGRVWHH